MFGQAQFREAQDGDGVYVVTATKKSVSMLFHVAEGQNRGVVQSES